MGGAAQAEDLCSVAQEVLDDETIESAQRVAAWRARLLARGVTHIELEGAIREAMELERPVDAAWHLATKVRSVTATDGTCDALDALVRGNAP